MTSMLIQERGVIRNFLELHNTTKLSLRQLKEEVGKFTLEIGGDEKKLMDFCCYYCSLTVLNTEKYCSGIYWHIPGQLCFILL